MSKKRRASLKWATQEAFVPDLLESDGAREHPLEHDELVSRPIGLNGTGPHAPAANLPADAFQQAPIPLVIINRKGTILGSNETASTLLGAPLPSLRGRRLLDLLPIPRERAETARLLEQSSRTTIPARLEVCIRCASHQRLRVELRFCAKSDQHSSQRVYVIALVDNSDARRTRSELQQEIQALRTQLDVHTGELRRLRVELSRMQRQNEELEVEVIETSEREKRKFGQHLHDETCQSLTGLSLLATVIARRVADQSETHAALQDLAAELKKVVEKTRNISWTLDPVILNGGLLPALRLLVRQTQDRVPCTLLAPEDLDLSEAVSLALFRIAKEAVQNAVRHSGASAIKLMIERSREELRLTVEDNGRGIRLSSPREDCALGIHMMRYRARSIGAELTLEKLSPSGTRVCCNVPLSSDRNQTRSYRGKP